MSGKAGTKLHEKHQLILANMLREEENRFCADCHAKGPRWASWNIGVFMCIRCAGIHRNLGVHISRVKSVNLDSWTPEQIQTIQKGGNGNARDKYEANLPSNFRRPQDDYSVEQFIRNKYQRKMYIAKDNPAVAKTTESKADPERVKVKETKKQPTTQKKTQLLGVPRPPTHTQRSSTPPAPSTSTPHTSPITASSSSPDLIAMETASARKQQPQQVDLLTGLSASSTSSPQQPSAQQPSLGEDPQRAVKDNILSLYQTQPAQGYQSYTAHGYPVNSVYYQQQHAASLRMAHQQQQQAARMVQVKKVEEQMRNLKMGQGDQQSFSNGQPLMQPVFPATGNPATAFPQPSGGQTLNPHLW